MSEEILDIKPREPRKPSSFLWLISGIAAGVVCVIIDYACKRYFLPMTDENKGQLWYSVVSYIQLYSPFIISASWVACRANPSLLFLKILGCLWVGLTTYGLLLPLWLSIILPHPNSIWEAYLYYPEHTMPFLKIYPWAIVVAALIWGISKLPYFRKQMEP